MLNFLSFNCLLVLCSANIIREPSNVKNLEQIVEKWEPHVRDFFNLIDGEKVQEIVFKYMNDTDVLNSVAFIGSSQFKDIVLEAESIEEFKEAVDYLESKGYDVMPIIELVNSILELQKQPAGYNSSRTVTNFIREIIQTLPIEEIKKLSKDKLEKNPEIAELFETLTAPEFKDILRRFLKNPKVLEIKKIFEGYGLDFKELSSICDDNMNLVEKI